MVNEYHIYAMDLATEQELADIAKMAFTVNDVLRNYLKDLNIDLIDFKIEFGRTSDGDVYKRQVHDGGRADDHRRGGGGGRRNR